MALRGSASDQIEAWAAVRITFQFALDRGSQQFSSGDGCLRFGSLRENAQRTPDYCLVAPRASVLARLTRVSQLWSQIDGPQDAWSEYSIRGQQQKFRDESLPEKDGGWYLVPGKIDRPSYYLLVFFVATLIFLAAFEALI